MLCLAHEMIKIYIYIDALLIIFSEYFHSKLQILLIKSFILFYFNFVFCFFLDYGTNLLWLGLGGRKVRTNTLVSSILH